MIRNKNKVLITGGSGYVGAQICRVLKKYGYEPIIIDFDKKRNWAVKDFTYFNYDFASQEALQLISKYKPRTVLHLAAYHLVSESVSNPDKYYLNNVSKTRILLESCVKNKVKNFILSGTGSVYGDCTTKKPLKENLTPKPSNPYADSKYTVERMLADYQHSFGLNYVSTRYFNAAGANPEGLNGYTQDPASHVVPILMEKIINNQVFTINGNDYETDDGTCIRDYCHINDIAEGKIAAIKFLENGGKSGVINLGSGKGYSVMELINSVQEITGKKLKIEVGSRRLGDVSYLCADISKAKELLGWEPKLSLLDIFQDSHEWIKNKSLHINS